MDDQQLIAWLLADADRCAGVVADAYAGWDIDKDWREYLVSEIQHAIKRDSKWLTLALDICCPAGND